MILHAYTFIYNKSNIEHSAFSMNWYVLSILIIFSLYQYHSIVAIHSSHIWTCTSLYSWYCDRNITPNTEININRKKHYYECNYFSFKWIVYRHRLVHFDLWNLILNLYSILQHLHKPLLFVGYSQWWPM